MGEERIAYLECKDKLNSIGGTCKMIKSKQVHGSEEQQVSKIH